MRTRLHCTAYFTAVSCLFAFLAPATLPAAARAHALPPKLAAAPSAVAVQRPSLANYLPSNALLYVEAENIPGALDEVLKVESLKRFLAAPDSGVPIDPTKYEQFLQILGLPDKTVLSATRIGVSVALTPPAPATPKTRRASAPGPSLPEPEIAVVADAPTDAAAQQLMDSTLRLFSQSASGKPTATRIGRFLVTTVPASAPKDSFAITRDGNVILAGQGPVVRKLATRLTQPGTESQGLGAQADYVSVRSQLTQPSNLVTYFNTKALGATLRDLVGAYFTPKSTPGAGGSKPRPGAKGARKGARAPRDTFTPATPLTPPAASEPSGETIAKLIELSGIASVGGFGFATGAQNGQYYQQSVFNVQHAKPGLIPAFFDGPNITAQAAALVPDSTQFFLTGSINHLRVFDTIFQMAALGGPTAARQALEFESNLGFRLRDDFLAGFTGEVAFALEGADFGALSGAADGSLPPQLHIAALASLSNPALVKSGLGKLFAAALQKYRESGKTDSAEPSAIKKIAPRSETYQGVELIILEDVAFAVFENFLAVARPGDVKRLIDVRRAGTSLTRLAAFRQMIERRPADAVAAVYVSESIIQGLVERAQNDVPPKYQPFLEGITPASFGFFAQRTPQSVLSSLSLPLPYLVGVFGAVYGATEAESQRKRNRAAAESALRDIVTAQQQYLNGPGGGASYGGTLQAIAVGPDGAKLLSDEIVGMQSTPHNGYLLGPLRVASGSGGQPPRFSITAYPAKRQGGERTGDDSLYIDETGELRRSGSPEKDADATGKPVN
jgi:hypothetical protein